jgi:two-component system sensor histidine kinase KdpD
MNSFTKYLAALLLVLAATLVGESVRLHLSPTNMVMVYLLAVVIAALRLGQRPAIVTAALGVLAFDVFFVPPRFSLTVADKEYLTTFLGLFMVGVVISSLVSKTRAREEELREREAETAALYRLSRDLASAPDSDAIFSAVIRNAGECFSADAALFLPTADDAEPRQVPDSGRTALSGPDLEAVRWCLKSARKAGTGTPNHPEAALLCLSLVSMGRCQGVLALSAAVTPPPDDVRLNRIMEGFAVQLKMALDRAELAHQAEQAQVLKAREDLERALLNSISHDLRTPLVTVTGVLSSLRERDTHLDDAARGELLETAFSEAERLNRFVGNLLDMTRLEAGGIRLKKEPCDVQELIGCALAAVGQRAGERAVQVALPPELPLVPMDLVLMTQVLVNLLDNSLKYAPAGQPVTVSAALEPPWLVVAVADRGHGVAEQELARIFDKFYRIPVPEGAGGTGLGLSICKGIVEAHGGTITAENDPQGGLKVSLRLPLAHEEVAGV